MYTSCGVIAAIVIISWGVYNYDSIEPVYFLNKAQILQEELDSGKLSKYEISSAQMNIRAYKDIYEKDVKRKENFNYFGYSRINSIISFVNCFYSYF